MAHGMCIEVETAVDSMDALIARVRGLLAVAVALTLGGALIALPGTALGVTAQQAIASLNAQRVANGLPGGIVENPEWSEGCRLHANYIALDGGIDFSNPHDENPVKPGYTPLGQTAARSAVLGGIFGADGSNGWEDAPIHLMQTLGPGLSVTGYADGCLWTWPGYQRAAPEQTALYSYPSTAAVPYKETANEWPFVPGEFVGLPQGVTTGPYLYVFAFGKEAPSVTVTSASLMGPDGAVEVRTVDNTTSGPKGGLGSYLPPGGMAIPVSPLRPDSSYTATVIGTSNGQTLTWTWSFHTVPKPKQTPVVGLQVDRTNVSVRSASDAPATLTVTRLPSRTLIWRAAVDPRAGGSTDLRSRLDGGRYEACLDQGESSDYAPVHVCEQFTWRAAAGLQWGPAARHGRRVRLVLRSGAAMGQWATVVQRSLRGRSTSRRLRLRASTVLWVSRGATVTVSVRAFAVGEHLYAAAHLRRTVR